MNATARDLKLPAVMILLAATLLMLLGGVNKAKADPVACTDYELRYNGRIGKVDFPKDNYAVTGINQEKIVCDYALENFQIFLQNFYGKTTRPWVMSSKVEDEVRTTTFRRGKKSKVGFAIASSIPSATNPPIMEAKACKGSYKFKKATRIGSFRIPKGSYRLGPVDADSFNCVNSAKKFKTFLKRGRLSSDWKLERSSATFSKRGESRSGFFLTKNVAAGET